MKKLLSILALSSLVGAASLQAQVNPGTGPSNIGGNIYGSFYCPLLNVWGNGKELPANLSLQNGKLINGVGAINKKLASMGFDGLNLTNQPTLRQLRSACGHATGLKPGQKHATGFSLKPNGAHCVSGSDCKSHVCNHKPNLMGSGVCGGLK